MHNTKADLRPILIVGILAILWILVATLVVPPLIKSAYRQESWQFLNDRFQGRSEQSVEAYLQYWNQLIWATPAMILFSLIVLWPYPRTRIHLILVLLLAVAARVPGMLNRAMWVDESYTLLETAGHAPPVWPTVPVAAGTVKYQYEGSASLSQVTKTLREIDVHPPIYFLGTTLWRRVFGASIESIRAFSVASGVLTILALYFLLKAARIEQPTIITIVYAMLTAAVFWDSEARNYSLATFFLTAGALFAYLAATALSEHRKVTACTIAMGVSLGLAFQTQYLTVFSIGVVLLWYVILVWPKSRWLALVSPLITLLIAIINFTTVLKHMGARHAQFSGGFAGFARELQALKYLLRMQIWQLPVFMGGPTLNNLVGAGIFILFGLTLWHVIFRRRETNQKFWILLLGLAIAPSVGILAMDLYVKTTMWNPQYIAWGAPAIAVALAYPIARLCASRRVLGSALLSFVFLLQLNCINWGLEAGPTQVSGDKMRSVANAIKQSWSPLQIVLIDEGCKDLAAGCGFQFSGAFIYYLDPKTKIVTFNNDSSLENLVSMAEGHQDIWIAFSGALKNFPEDNLRHQLLKRLETPLRRMELSRLTSSDFPFYYHSTPLRVSKGNRDDRLQLAPPPILTLPRIR